MYGAVAAFGLTAVSTFLIGQQFWFRLVGGIFLLYLGAKTFLSKTADKAASATHKGLFSDYASTVFLTITNPMSILAFVAIFAGLGLAGAQGSHSSPALMVAGVVLGSALWWLLLSFGVSLLGPKLNSGSLNLVSRASGAIIVGFGIFALAGVSRIPR